MSESLDFAREVITGVRVPSAAEALKNAAALKEQDRFDLTRRVLAAVGVTEGDPDYAAVKQELALATYKDRDLPSPQRLHDALAILTSALNLDRTEDTETLGLAGAIYKLLWQDGGQRAHVEKSYSYYRRAHDLHPADDGYVSINAAYLLDVLASQESAGIAPLAPVVPEQRFDEAAGIRESLIAQLVAQGRPASPDPTKAWWYWASLAEAALGVARYDDAKRWIAEGLRTKPHRWMTETSARQMVAVSRIQHGRKGNVRSKAEEVLKDCDGFALSDAAINSAFIGKVGLALSGGGFRASLFHIGVLAKLAELDVLRHVEVLSCVSGGSIIGAYYYLGLKRLLESKYDSSDPRRPQNEPYITQHDYIALVQDIERDFLAGVQRNLRTRIATNPIASLKMAVVPGYTRTERAGELYESELYERVDEIKHRSMDSLLVMPKGAATFNPKNDNWHRDAKVPILVLNATALNSGHNWQFTATWMGESPQAIGKAIDAIPRLRRLYYKEAPDGQQHVPLGRAVGASAAVPGVFDPIVMKDLYPDHTVRLCDGGVHDNQGLASLLEQGCKVILVSDASGQIEKEEMPGGSIGAVAGRSNSILQARVREAQYFELQARVRSGAIDGAMFIHLTKDLDADPISFIGATDSDEMPQPRGPKTSYGVDRRIQKQLAEVRTDLDSFSDAEAYALMTSAYLMTQHAFDAEKCAPTLGTGAGASAYWRFLGAEEALTNVGSADNTRMHGLLVASKELALKPWRQQPALKAAAVVGGLAVAVGAGILVKRHWADTAQLPLSVRGATIAAGVAAAAVAVRFGSEKLFHVQKRFGEFLLGTALATAGTAASWLHLGVFDPIFLWTGEWPPAKETKDGPIVAAGPKLPVKEPRRPLLWRALHSVAPRVNKGETSPVVK